MLQWLIMHAIAYGALAAIFTIAGWAVMFAIFGDKE